MLITPNNIKRSDKTDLHIEQDTDGIYTVKNVYEGQYVYFEDVPLGSDKA